MWEVVKGLVDDQIHGLGLESVTSGYPIKPSYHGYTPKTRPDMVLYTPYSVLRMLHTMGPPPVSVPARGKVLGKQRPSLHGLGIIAGSWWVYDVRCMEVCYGRLRTLAWRGVA